MPNRTSLLMFISAGIMVALYAWLSGSQALMPDLMGDARLVQDKVAAAGSASNNRACSANGPC